MTDGTEHPGGAPAPEQDSRHTQPTMPDPRVAGQVPGQDAAPGAAAPAGAAGQGGGYGYPQPQPQPQPQEGYGYPHPQSGYGYPQPQGQFPPQFQQPAAPFPQQGAFPPGPQQQFAPPVAAPDWEALADRGEAQTRRRRRMLTIGIVVVACVLGVVAGTVIIERRDGGAKPVASESPSAPVSASGSGAPGDQNSPTVAGQPNLLADRSGQAHLALGPDALVSKVQDGYVLRLRSNGNSFAQSADRVVDVTKSFTVSAWVYNEAPDGSRVAMSEGDGISHSFELGRDDSNGKKSWVFRVQTADGGADATTVQVFAENANTVRQWALLTGVYDKDQQTISLYVNETLAATAKTAPIWAGPGPLQLGRSRHHGIWGNPWAGVLGHILVWDQALTPAQVASLKGGGTGQDAKPTGSWLVG
ncbi:LamG domain-containing protein [Kitasatospora sp. NPDC088346]|uniref:LamG domain-containing protein n=1 Tax=Kitasatospora sp. NPDC088346 TaxID=3364073 RepID=UPI0038205E98